VRRVAEQRDPVPDQPRTSCAVSLTCTAAGSVAASNAPTAGCQSAYRARSAPSRAAGPLGTARVAAHVVYQ
jgi:hypothetical protein